MYTDDDFCTRCDNKYDLYNVEQLDTEPEVWVCRSCLTSFETNYLMVRNDLIANDLQQSVQKPNPKAAMGVSKVPFHSVMPASGLIEIARVMKYGAYDAKRKDGSSGYGPFNWREDGIDMGTYLDAIERHLLAIADGEDIAQDSLCLHFAHIAANCIIAIDAMDLGMMIDNRPPKGGAPRLLEKYKESI